MYLILFYHPQRKLNNTKCTFKKIIQTRKEEIQNFNIKMKHYRTAWLC